MPESANSSGWGYTGIRAVLNSIDLEGPSIQVVPVLPNQEAFSITADSAAQILPLVTLVGKEIDVRVLAEFDDIHQQIKSAEFVACEAVGDDDSLAAWRNWAAELLPPTP